MMDIKGRSLPDAIEADGQVFLIETDFRAWMGYPECLMAGGGSGYAALFAGSVPLPSQSIIDALDVFAFPPSEVPKKEQSGEALVDWDVDSDYIYAAFLQAYGIDLLVENMHWHKFLALFNALPENTLIASIIGWRAYKGDDKELKKLQQAWSLPVRLTQDDREAVDEFNKYFG